MQRIHPRVPDQLVRHHVPVPDADARRLGGQREALPAFRQRRLRQLALRDVARDADDADERAGRVPPGCFVGQEIARSARQHRLFLLHDPLPGRDDLFVGLAEAPRHLRREEFLVGPPDHLGRRFTHRLRAGAVDDLVTTRAVLGEDGVTRALDHGGEQQVLPLERRHRALPADGHRREVRGQLDAPQMLRTRPARLPIVNGEGAQHALLFVKDGRGPAGTQPVRQRQFAVIRPQRIGGDVLDEHRLAPEGRGAARTGARADGLPLDGAVERLRQTRRHAHLHPLAVGVEQQHRAKHPRRERLDMPQHRVERLGQRRARGDFFQHERLEGRDGRGQFARSDVSPEIVVGLLELQRLLLQLADEHLAVFLEQHFFPARRLVGGRDPAGLAPGQHFAHARHERLRLGGLENEGARPQIERELLVLRLGVGGGIADERNRFEALVGLPLAQERVAVHHRHEQVGDDEGRRRLAGLDQRLGAVAGLGDFVAVAGEQGAQEVKVYVLVIDDEDFHGGLFVSRSSSSSCGWTIFSKQPGQIPWLNRALVCWLM